VAPKSQSFSSSTLSPLPRIYVLSSLWFPVFLVYRYNKIPAPILGMKVQQVRLVFFETGLTVIISNGRAPQKLFIDMATDMISLVSIDM